MAPEIVTSVMFKFKFKLCYLHWLGLALYPVLVLAAPLPGCGAILSVPAALPPLVFLTSERSQRKQIVKEEPITILQRQNH